MGPSQVTTPRTALTFLLGVGRWTSPDGFQFRGHVVFVLEISTVSGNKSGPHLDRTVPLRSPTNPARSGSRGLVQSGRSAPTIHGPRSSTSRLSHYCRHSGVWATPGTSFCPSHIAFTGGAVFTHIGTKTQTSSTRSPSRLWSRWTSVLRLSHLSPDLVGLGEYRGSSGGGSTRTPRPLGHPDVVVRDRGATGKRPLLPSTSPFVPEATQTSDPSPHTLLLGKRYVSGNHQYKPRWTDTGGRYD